MKEEQVRKKQMNKEELLKLTEELAIELRNIGIPISKDIEDVIINTRAKARFGACKARKNKLGTKKFTIEISEEVLGCETKDISTIIIHELLHTCRGCFNHGKKWKSHCEQVEQRLGYKISRTGKYEDLGIERPAAKEQVRYIVKCSGCGAEFPRKRMCNLVKNPEHYRCAKCGNILYLEGKNPHIL